MSDGIGFRAIEALVVRRMQEGDETMIDLRKLAAHVPTNDEWLAARMIADAIDCGSIDVAELYSEMRLPLARLARAAAQRERAASLEDPILTEYADDLEKCARVFEQADARRVWARARELRHVFRDRTERACVHALMIDALLRYTGDRR